MKKMIVAFTLATTLFSGSGFAQPASMGKAPAPKRASSDQFAWAPALTGIAILGVVVGIVAGTASSSPNTYSH